MTEKRILGLFTKPSMKVRKFFKELKDPHWVTRFPILEDTTEYENMPYSSPLQEKSIRLQSRPRDLFCKRLDLLRGLPSLEDLVHFPHDRAYPARPPGMAGGLEL